MKRIYFDDLHAKWYSIPLLAITIAALVYFLFTSGQGLYAKEVFFVSLCFSSFSLARKFWHKAYVSATPSRISIRINSTSQLNIKFDDITHIEYAKTKLIIKENSKTHTIDVEDIRPKDIMKLVQLLIDRSDAFYQDTSTLTYYD